MSWRLTVHNIILLIIIPQMIKFYVSAHNDSLFALGGQWCDKPGSFIPLFKAAYKLNSYNYI